MPTSIPQPEDLTPEPLARPAGRPLDENVDEAILNGAWEVLLDEGYAKMTIARVAEVARVGRPAIYRRYKDKAELIRATLADKRARAAPVDTGTARGDMIAFMEFSRLRFQVSLAGTLLVDGRKHPELMSFFRQEMLGPRTAEMVAALERGKKRGEVRQDLDSRLAIHALMGSFMFHNLASDRPPKGWATEIVDTLWHGFAA